MSRKAIADAIREETGMTHAEADRAVERVVAAMARSLREEGRFALSGFGTLAVRDRPERAGVNPRTGDPMVIPARRTVRFKPSPALRGVV